MSRLLPSIKFKPIDFIPALSGLIGKAALISSFAVVWAAELHITTPDFVFENVRIELIIGSIITLLVALLWKDAAPIGTLAPFVLLIPMMVHFGVHPLLLSLIVGIFGLIGNRIRLFHYLIKLSGNFSKISLTLTFGISGIVMSLKKLIVFYHYKFIPFLAIVMTTALCYLFLLKWKKVWLIIPFAAVLAMTLSIIFGFSPERITKLTMPIIDSSYWWNTMWGIGYGFQIETMIKTIPFALFVLLLWSVDTVSITAIRDANYYIEETKEDINLDRTFLTMPIRNMIGGLMGGAQTAALWRSFLIPLFTVKRPMQPASILLGILGIAAGFSAAPIKILSFPPLIWTVLLFGIFLPFVIVGIKSFFSIRNKTDKAAITVMTLSGLFFNPIFAWIIAVLYEKIKERKSLKSDNTNGIVNFLR